MLSQAKWSEEGMGRRKGVWLITTSFIPNASGSQVKKTQRSG